MVLNIAAYRFVRIDDPDLLAQRLRGWAETLALRGTVLVAEEGINLFLAGAEASVRDFLSRLREDQRFAPIEVKESISRSQPFGRLKVKRKREIIAFRREGAAPLPGRRAPTVSPDTLARWIERGSDDADAASSCSTRAIARKSPTAPSPAHSRCRSTTSPTCRRPSPHVARRWPMPPS